MIIIEHRVNSIKHLKLTNKDYGVEIDVRSNGSELILDHDPYIDGVFLSDWIKHFDHNFIIFNIKEEGLEEKILYYIKKFNISNYFILDQSFPYLIKFINKGYDFGCLRLSEYENLYNIDFFIDKINWIWVDYFNIFPLDKKTYIYLKENNFKICLVSPELQGYKIEKIYLLIDLLKTNNIKPDAVCTKHTKIWKEKF